VGLGPAQLRARQDEPASTTSVAQRASAIVEQWHTQVSQLAHRATPASSLTSASRSIEVRGGQGCGGEADPCAVVVERRRSALTRSKQEKRMATATIRDNHILYNGVRYFRANSEEVELGSYGEKRTPLFGANYLEVYKNLPFEKLEVEDAVIAGIDFSHTTEHDFSAKGNLEVLGISGKVSAGQTYSKLRSGELSLLKLSVKRGAMVDAINASPNARETIDSLGNDARVAHQIFVVMEAKLAEQMASATRFGVSASKGDLTLELDGGVKSSGTTTVTLSEGSTFAYLLLDLEWNHPSKKKRTKVVGAKDDQWGLV
jgi:hypothetical protein